MYHRIFPLFLFFVLNIQNSGSQNNTDIDSLLAVYKNHPKDTIKAKKANQIINYYMYRSSGIAKKYAFELLDLSNEIDFDSGKALALYQLGVVYNNIDKLDSARYYYNSSLKLANKIDNGVYKSKAYRGLAIIEFSQGHLLKADSINNLDLENTIQHGDTMGMALAYDFKGTIHQNKGYYSIALKNVLKGLKLFETIGNSIRIADSYNHLATIEHTLGNLENAIAYNKKALKIYEDHNDIYYQAVALNDIGIMYMKSNQEEIAIEYYERSLIKSRQAKVKSTEAATLTGLGSAYLQLNNPEQAIKYYNQSILTSKSINGKRRIAVAQNKLSEAYIQINDYNKAIKTARAAMEYANTHNNISIERESNRQLSSAYEYLGNYNLSLSFHKAFKKINDSIINEEKIKTIEEQRVQFDTEKKEVALRLQEQEIKTLNQEVEITNLRKSLYAGGMMSFLALSGLLYFGFKQRIKKNKIAREKQEEIYKQEIAFKKKELTSQTLHLVQKNTFIQELKENLEKIKKSPELFKVEFRRLVMLLKKESAEDKDWEIFKSYFSEVHNNFDNKLKTIYASISEKEIRLASFLRMNLSTKEIASMLNVLPDSVLKSKYRLKKKLGLDKDTDLNNYLNTL
ncbi:tetratricopeptide repeat protein [Jejuia spongiicola]|uniref:Tetratricopeptide repeat protein n=1 Tax=Jejuia spongiicola TaxID=2942207 RepID=A0ABT0QE46_9FLAO|nr:tetratricopeptide repeat protein [Jejuia spongiicola]MCL6295257.1 tetratricopeptide repeat protein [Jejuia spongiicola]